MTEIPFSPGTALDMGVCLLGDFPGQISHLSSPPGPASREGQTAASTSHYCIRSSRGGEQEAELASLALRPYLRDHHAQPPSIYK